MTDLLLQPHSVVPAVPSIGRRCRLVLATLVVALLAVGVTGFLAVDAAAAVPAQDPATEAPTVGSGSDEPVTTTTAPAVGAGSRRVADENRKIWVVVAGLVAVAVVLSLLTFRYWRQTRPVRPAAPTTVGDDEDHTAVHAAATEDDADDHTAIHAAATEDDADDHTAIHAAATEDDADDHTAIHAAATEDDVLAEAAPLAPAPVPSTGAAASQTDGGEDDGEIDGDDDSEFQGRLSRRTVAGADHAAADDEWEPRGTGEHDRVVIPTAERVPRPDRSQRAAAYEAGRSS